ncbi:MAG TPA: hypothetical protein VM531_12040, partial [Sphingomicrobium sp.]|nr:hypothetical protein [Sphingomicrobium sp.]
MTKPAVVTALTMLTGSAAFAQAYDPDIGSGNLTTMPPVVIILPSACETRRMQFEDASVWRMRDVLVCCA